MNRAARGDPARGGGHKWRGRLVLVGSGLLSERTGTTGGDGMLDGFNDVILDLAGSPWVYLIVFAFVAIDAFFPPVPSESAIVALAAIAMSHGEPELLLLVLVSVAGALVGDNTAFALGRRLGTERFAILRRPKSRELIERAEAELDKRAATLILTARYIPVGRVAVNVTAGATGFRYRRFLPLAVLAAVSWALFNVAIGVAAGAWVKDNPLLGAGVAIVFALVVGVVIDKILARRRRASHDASPRPAS
jgi:membrane-associated protein